MLSSAAGAAVLQELEEGTLEVPVGVPGKRVKGQLCQGSNPLFSAKKHVWDTKRSSRCFGQLIAPAWLDEVVDVTHEIWKVFSV